MFLFALGVTCDGRGGLRRERLNPRVRSPGVLAFVLCGVNPSERTNPVLVQFSLRQLLANANVKRVGTVSGLREDHQFLLAPRFDFAKVDFEDVWKEASRYFEETVKIGRVLRARVR